MASPDQQVVVEEVRSWLRDGPLGEPPPTRIAFLVFAGALLGTPLFTIAFDLIAVGYGRFDDRFALQSVAISLLAGSVLLAIVSHIGAMLEGRRWGWRTGAVLGATLACITLLPMLDTQARYWSYHWRLDWPADQSMDMYRRWSIGASHGLMLSGFAALTAVGALMGRVASRHTPERPRMADVGRRWVASQVVLAWTVLLAAFVGLGQLWYLYDALVSSASDGGSGLLLAAPTMALLGLLPFVVGYRTWRALPKPDAVGTRDRFLEGGFGGIVLVAPFVSLLIQLALAASDAYNRNPVDSSLLVEPIVDLTGPRSVALVTVAVVWATGLLLYPLAFRLDEPHSD